jgi:hypothetical protein
VQQHPKDPPSEETVSRSDLNQTREEVLAYWTVERIAEAKPREVRLPKPGPHPASDD